MLSDLIATLKKPANWMYSAWITFLLRYRKTRLGPLWILAGPAAFILVLGTLFGSVMGHDPRIYVPRLTVGLVIWQYITTVMQTASRLYVQSRPFLLQGDVNHMTLVMRALFSAFVLSAHHVVIIAVTFLIYGTAISSKIFLLVPALALLFAHSIWVLVAFGILGARYRDLAEVVDAVMRIAFLATPIMWMVGESDARSSIIGIYLALNPFYHVLEPIRGAILGTPVLPVSWLISTSIAAAGLAIAQWFYAKYRHLVVLWI